MAADLATVAAALTLARRGISLLKAKRALEEMLATGRAVVRLPVVEDGRALGRELTASGVTASLVSSDEIDVRAIRERLGLTQEQFSLRFGLELNSLQNWEMKRRKPDTAVRSYLKVIARMPDRASEALEEAIP